jgi:hypothetical protein
MKKFILPCLFLLSSLLGMTQYPCEPAISCFAFINIDDAIGCDYLLTPEDILYEGPCPEETYTIDVYTNFDDPGFSGPIDNPVPYDYFATTIYASITQASNGNFCWAEITIKNASPPFIIVHDNPGTISCQDDDIGSLIATDAIDYCDEDNELNIELIDINYLCRLGTTDSVEFTYSVSDSRGQEIISTYGFPFIDFCAFVTFPEDVTVSCAEDLPDPFISFEDVLDCPKTIDINYSDISIIGECDITRIFIFTEESSGLQYIHEQQIEVDNILPIITVDPTTSIPYADFESGSFIPYTDVDDNCGDAIVTYGVEYLEPEDCARPEFSVRYHLTATDLCGNESTASKDLLVIRDGVAKVKLKGIKDCDEDFILEAETSNLIPPIFYVWNSSNPGWGIFVNPDNTAVITPGSGQTDIEVIAYDALGCSVRTSKKYTCGRKPKTRSVDAIAIGPNPFEDQLYIKNIYGSSQITIIDLQGKIVFHDNQQDLGGVWQKDLADVPAGIYILKLINAGEEKLSKIVKTH